MYLPCLETHIYYAYFQKVPTVPPPTPSPARSLRSLAQARSQGGGGGGRPPKNAPKKRKKGRERERKREENNHFKSKITYKFVLYEENTGHMHQIAPLTTSKCKKLSLWEGGVPPPTPSPLARYARSGSVASLPRTLFFTAPLKLNPGYATALAHIFQAPSSPPPKKLLLSEPRLLSSTH